MSRPGEREQAFTQFVETGTPALLRAAYVLLGTREEAEDAVQLALLRTLQHWDRAQDAPAAYTRAVLVNVCREHWRYGARHPEITGLSGDATTLAVITPFTDAVDHRRVLVGALRRLPEVQREVLVFRYLLDASVTETAVALGLPEGTVKSAASRGLDQLRGLLSGDKREVRRGHQRRG